MKESECFLNIHASEHSYETLVNHSKETAEQRTPSVLVGRSVIRPHSQSSLSLQSNTPGWTK